MNIVHYSEVGGVSSSEVGNVWSACCCRQGARSLSIGGRLSARRSVHYRRFHCSRRQYTPPVHTTEEIRLRVRQPSGEVVSVTAGKGERVEVVKAVLEAKLGEQVGDNRYFVFQDHKGVCFITNVFPEKMDSKVVRPQPGGVLRAQSVPPLLPAYNKFMGGVDRTDQFRKSYGFDRKSRHSWIRLFFQFLDYAVNNAYLLYKHGCKRQGQA